MELHSLSTPFAEIITVSAPKHYPSYHLWLFMQNSTDIEEQGPRANARRHLKNNTFSSKHSLFPSNSKTYQPLGTRRDKELIFHEILRHPANKDQRMKFFATRPTRASEKSILHRKTNSPPGIPQESNQKYIPFLWAVIQAFTSLARAGWAGGSSSPSSS
jgi:hypothetical protein